MKSWESRLEHFLRIGIHLRDAHQAVLWIDNECVGGGERRILGRKLLSGRDLVVSCEIFFPVNVVPVIRGDGIVGQIPDQKVSPRQLVENGGRKVILPNEIASANWKFLRSYSE